MIQFSVLVNFDSVVLKIIWEERDSVFVENIVITILVKDLTLGEWQRSAKMRG